MTCGSLRNKNKKGVASLVTALCCFGGLWGDVVQHLGEKAGGDSSSVTLLPNDQKCLQHLSTAFLMWKNHLNIAFEHSVEELRGF